jgi:hypothetical protein
MRYCESSAGESALRDGVTQDRKSAREAKLLILESGCRRCDVVQQG